MPTSSMMAFFPYVSSLESLIQSTLDDHAQAALPSTLHSILDGQPSTRLRELVDIKSRKASGAFFTNSLLRTRAASYINSTISPKSIIFDPACGAGDLLIACTSHLSIEKDLESTLLQWGNQLSGLDIHPEFVRAAKARLFLAAIERMPKCNIRRQYDPNDWFPLIQVGDGLSNNELVKKTTHIILNPPFGMTPAPDKCHWTSGQVSMAALFLERIIANAQPNTHLIAILPDVIRTGTESIVH